jgi:hypothetical protein
MTTARDVIAEILCRAAGPECDCGDSPCVYYRTADGLLASDSVRQELAALLNPVLADVANERCRQEAVEGWTAEHDDKHTGGELAMAAACYAMFAERGYRKIDPPQWPWAPRWWKPKAPRHNLVRAAALLIAEIQRLDRLPAPPSEDIE